MIKPEDRRIVLWGRPSSVNVQKVLWALAELDLPFEHHIVGGRYGATDTPEFRALTPVPRVPVLQDCDLTVWESHSILRHLAGSVGPVADQWMEYTTSTSQPAFLRLFWHLVRTRPEDRTDDLGALTQSFLKALAPLNARLSTTEWLGGNTFGMADIAAGVMFYRACDLCDPLTENPHLLRWYNALKARPAYADIVMTTYEELRA